MPKLIPAEPTTWYVHVSTSRSKQPSSYKHSYLKHTVPACVVVPHTSNLVHTVNNTGTKLYGPYTTEQQAYSIASKLIAQANPNYVYPSQPVCKTGTPKRKPKLAHNTTPIANNKRMRQIKRSTH